MQTVRGISVAFFGRGFLGIPARMQRTVWRLRTKHVYDGRVACFCVTSATR